MFTPRDQPDRLLIFETGEDKRVTSFRAGHAQVVRLIEGCLGASPPTGPVIGESEARGAGAVHGQTSVTPSRRCASPAEPVNDHAGAMQPNRPRPCGLSQILPGRR